MVRLVLVVVALGGAVALADDKKAEKGNKPAKGAKVKLDPDLAEILKLINKERAKNKLPELTLDPTLCKVAEDYSNLMANKEKMAHELDKQKSGPRILAAGYDYRTAAENLAGSSDRKKQPVPPAELVEGWMRSPEHKKNILEGKHVHTGLGMALGKDGNYYYTQLFASLQKAVVEQRQEIFALVNVERAKQKIAALTLDPTLDKAAQQYAELMAKNEKCAGGLDGKKVGERVRAAGYDWKVLDENLASAPAKSYPTPADLVADWTTSEGHRENVLNAKHVHTGVGMARSKNGDYYYTQLFASPSK